MNLVLNARDATPPGGDDHGATERRGSDDTEAARERIWTQPGDYRRLSSRTPGGA